MIDEPSPRPQNVVIVLADDLGWGDTGCYGAEAVPTPRIDELASAGVRFTDAHAASAVCTPSRYALMTGSYPWRSPLKSGVLGGFDPPLIPADRPTLASTLRERGRTTAYFGKWHLGLTWTRTDGSVGPATAPQGVTGNSNDAGRDIDYATGFTGGPTQLGFDTFFGLAASFDMAPYCFLEDDHTVGLPDREKVTVAGQRPGLTVSGWEDDQADLIMINRACTWIKDQIAADHPFLIVVGTLSPHRPCVPPEQFRGRSAAGRRGDAVTMVDELLGRIRDAVEPVSEQTMIIFTSDNGAPMNYPDDGDTFIHRPNGPWRGQKADIWEAGHRIPLIISGPTVPHGQTCDATVSLLDLLPTLLELDGSADHNDSHQWDGRSFAHQLAEPDRPYPEPRTLGVQSLNGMLALRWGSRKAIFGTGSGGFTELKGRPDFTPDARGQLYDLSDDPGEMLNRWNQFPDEARQRLSEFTARTGFEPSIDAPG